MTPPPTPQLVLASTSRYRRALLERLGLPFLAVAPAVDEEALKDPSQGAQARAEALALAKAHSLRAENPGATIIGSDQVCECNGSILSKPGDFAGAVRQLRSLSGQTHRLLTAVAVLQGQQTFTFTDITSLRMRSLTDAEIDRYLRADEPYDCAGSYKLEQRGITLFEAIDSGDHTAITGLPLIALTGVLRGCGFAVP